MAASGVRLASVPIEIDRDTAAELARRELADPIYTTDTTPWAVRAIRAVLERISDFVGALGLAGGGLLGAIILTSLLVALAVVVWVFMGPRGRLARRRRADGAAVFVGHRRRSAADHRSESVAAAAGGDWDVAVLERVRALVRELEERAVIDDRAGHTADEVAATAGAARPDLHDDLRSAARVFDDIAYGGRPGTPAAYEAVCELDDRIRGRAAARSGHR